MIEPVSAADLVKVMSLPKHKKVGKGEGQVVSALGATFSWKVKGVDTGYAFAVYEMTVEPGRGIPLHMHPFAEFFYVLEGCVDIMGIDAKGTLEWVPVAEGESANAAINAPHGLLNRTDRTARFLSVANFQHETLFNEYSAILEAVGQQTMSQQDQIEVFQQVAAKYQGNSVQARE